MIDMQSDPSVAQFLSALLQDVTEGKVQGLAIAVDYKFADMAHASEVFKAIGHDASPDVHENMQKSVAVLASKFGCDVSIDVKGV